MELTKSEAKVVIAGRVPRKNIGKIALLCVLIFFIGAIMVVSGTVENYYQLSSGKTISLNTSSLVYDNGELLEPFKTERTNVAGEFVGFILILGASFFFVLHVIYFSTKSQKEALIQYEKDDTLPPIPPEKPKKVRK